MADRLFDVFISSTQRDLAVERAAVSNALLTGSYRPVQMEAFPATRRRADELIRDLVLKSDVVILIIGTEYGSIVPNTVKSFTEHEYDAARDAGVPVLAFLKAVDDPSALPPAVARFRASVEAHRVCQYWDDPATLTRKVMQSLEWEVADSKAAGWIRADRLGDRPNLVVEQLVVPALTLGISGISVDGNAGSEMGEHLRRSREIRFMSTSGIRLIESQKSALVAALAAGGTLRVLTPTPHGPVLADCEELEGRDPTSDTISAEIEIVRKRLWEIAAESGAGERCHLAFMTTQLRTTMTLTDDWGWISMILPPKRTPETGAIELSDNGPRSLLRAAQAHFDAVWAIVEARGHVETFR